MNWQKFLLALKKAMSHPFAGVRWSGMKPRVILRPIMKHGEAIRCEVFTDDLLSSITLDVPVNAFHNLKVNARDLLEAA